MTTKWKVLAVFVGCLAIGIVGGTIAFGGDTPTTDPADTFGTDPLDAFGPAELGEPLLSPGEEVSLDEAQSILDQPVSMPATQDASEASLVEVWANPDTREVAMGFDSGVRIFITGWPKLETAADAAREFYSQQAKESEVGAVKELNGSPAYVVAAGAQAEGVPAESVALVTVEGLEYSVHGGGLSPETVEEIVGSIAGGS
jgi:hypothetical protein